MGFLIALGVFACVVSMWTQRVCSRDDEERERRRKAHEDLVSPPRI